MPKEQNCPVARHPEHDAVCAEVRSWYTASTPAIGLWSSTTRYGVLLHSDRIERNWLLLSEDAPEAVADALGAATDFYGSSAFEVYIDERSRAERLTTALTRAGMKPVQDTVTLALVGPVRADPGPEALVVEEVADLERLREWATVKIQGFADAEGHLAPERLQRELTERGAEWPVCRYLLARLGHDAVAILGHYTGQDQMVFNLATRLPFRHRGIAQSMLARWSKEPGRPPIRSHLINCDDKGPADALYRRLGFTDEVYWYRRYCPRD